jgi:hypothetical protein
MADQHPQRAYWVAERLPDGSPNLDAEPARRIFAEMDQRDIMLGGHA